MIRIPSRNWILVGAAYLILGAGVPVVAQAVDGAPDVPAAVAQLREQVLAAMDAGDEGRAFELARRTVRLAPEDPQAVYLMALMLGERHRFPEAIKMLDDLVEKVTSSRLPALGQTAEWMVKSGQWSEAESRYRTVLDEVPDSILVNRNLSSLYLRQGRRQEAAQLLHQLCLLGDVRESELRPLLMIVQPFAGDAEKESFDPIGALGSATIEIGKGDWEGARRVLESAKAEHPDEVALLGRVYAQLDDQKALKAWVETVPQSANESANYWYAIGRHQAQQGEHRKAVEAFCEAVLRNQTDSQAYAALSQSLERIGATREAEQTRQRAALIEKTQGLGAAMAENPTRDYAEISSLIDLLGQLQRPMEALAWRAVRLAYGRTHGSISHDQGEEILTAVIKERTERLRNNQTEASRPFLLCGIDLASINRQEP